MTNPEEMQKRQESVRKISDCYPALTSHKHKKAATQLKYAAQSLQIRYRSRKIKYVRENETLLGSIEVRVQNSNKSK